MKKTIQILAMGAVIAAIVGCGGGQTASGSGAPDSSPSPASQADATYAPKNVDAGMKVGFGKDSTPSYEALKLASSKFGVRSDPFALTSDELAYDRQQNAERVMGEMNGMVDLHQEKEDNVQPPELEDQPYRRLAGIIVGDSVLALIDMGNGSLDVIRPGEKIPNSEWTVVSIDQDKAVLHRDGPIAPHTVTVRLESPPPGMTGGMGGFNGSPTGAGPGNGMGPGMGIPGGKGAAGRPGIPGGG